MEKVLVVGSSSYIGRWLVERLLEEYDVVGLDRTMDNERKGDYEQIEFDLANENVPKVNGIDFCVHLAALTDVGICEKDPKLSLKVNVLGTLNMLELAKENKIKKYVYVSTGTVYGYSDEPLTEKSPINLANIYSLTKYHSELLCNYYSKYFPVDVLRYFFPYGPKTHPSRMIASIIKRVINKQPVTLNIGNKPITNPIYISDLVELTKMSMERESIGFDVFNIAGEEKVSIKDIADIVGKAAGIEPIFEKKDTVSKNFIADITKLKEIFDYKFKFNLEKGINETVRWIKNTNYH